MITNQYKQQKSYMIFHAVFTKLQRMYLRKLKKVTFAQQTSMQRQAKYQIYAKL